MDATNVSPSSEGLQNEQKQLPTAGELMRSVSQSVQRLYRDELNHRTERVTSSLVADKLVIWIEGSVNSVTRLLRREATEGVQTLHNALRQLIRRRIVQIVEEQLQVKVVTLVSDTCYEQECTGLIVCLSDLPAVRAAKGPLLSGRKVSSDNTSQSKRASN